MNYLGGFGAQNAMSGAQAFNSQGPLGGERNLKFI